MYLALFPGHSQILSCNCDKSVSGLGVDCYAYICTNQGRRLFERSHYLLQVHSALLYILVGQELCLSGAISIGVHIPAPKYLVVKNYPPGLS